MTWRLKALSANRRLEWFPLFFQFRDGLFKRVLLLLFCFCTSALVSGSQGVVLASTFRIPNIVFPFFSLSFLFPCYGCLVTGC